MKDEKDMLLRLKNGDTEAFACVYRRYWRKVYRFASLYITLPADVEEVVQDVFLSLWKKRGTIEVEQGLDGYLFIATRNTVFNHLRRHFNYSFYRATVEEAVGNSYNNVEEVKEVYIDYIPIYYNYCSILEGKTDISVYHANRNDGVYSRGGNIVRDMVGGWCWTDDPQLFTSPAVCRQYVGEYPYPNGAF